MGNIVGKVWGDTSVLIQNPLVELHRINTKAGYKCSEHKHAHKWNGFYVISGTMEIHVRKSDYNLTDVTVLRAGDFTTVRPGEYHWFSSITDCSALEIYYPETLSEDIVRKSVGGRDVSQVSDIVGGYGTLNRSPCVSICKLDEVTGKCVGCGRTIEQIQDAGNDKLKVDNALFWSGAQNVPYEGYDK